MEDKLLTTKLQKYDIQFFHYPGFENIHKYDLNTKILSQTNSFNKSSSTQTFSRTQRVKISFKIL